MPNNIIVVFYSLLLLSIIITASLAGPAALVPIGRVFKWFQLQFQFETASVTVTFSSLSDPGLYKYHTHVQIIFCLHKLVNRRE
ncbi:uncharacterized protein LAJ45_09326 [Morchella importuna]|uniref:uncharacterized protein n=1 Tax=Morchella importuna TaxID=1174673 RepID=UPI001E8DF598|nr:uncharacterized protein LAJ45_09326 [Morchella importuna]KAH8146643.1 hypothetical protein LAJ45_09326 [Morchella importuna]